MRDRHHHLSPGRRQLCNQAGVITLQLTYKLCERAEPILPLALGVVQRLVRRRYQLRWRERVLRVGGDADAEGQVMARRRWQ